LGTTAGGAGSGTGAGTGATSAGAGGVGDLSSTLFFHAGDLGDFFLKSFRGPNGESTVLLRAEGGGDADLALLERLNLDFLRCAKGEAVAPVSFGGGE